MEQIFNRVEHAKENSQIWIFVKSPFITNKPHAVGVAAMAQTKVIESLTLKIYKKIKKKILKIFRSKVIRFFKTSLDYQIFLTGTENFIVFKTICFEQQG